jgi:hypothetical protein
VLGAIRRLVAADQAIQSRPPGPSAVAGVFVPAPIAASIPTSMRADPAPIPADSLAARAIEGREVPRRLRLDRTRRVDLEDRLVSLPRLDTGGVAPVQPALPAARRLADFLEEDEFADAFAWKERAAVTPPPVVQAPEDSVSPVAVVPSVALKGLDLADLRIALREMIREELQGELGARLSGNLRSVIRREIAIALDAQD